MSGMIRTRATVAGRVQGVGFRYYTRQVAGAYEVTGFVRNLVDGNVEVEVQGPEGEVRRFLGDVRIGPPGSRVDEIDTENISTRPEENGFDIRF